MKAANRSVNHVESGEGKPHEGALPERGYGLSAPGGPKEPKDQTQAKGSQR